MDNISIPRLSKDYIELKAQEVIEYYNKSILSKATFTPLMSFVESLNKDFHVEFNFKNYLGISSSGRKILGQFRFPKTIHISLEIVESKRFPFVLAHEMGHLILHRKLKLPKGEYNTITDTELEYDLVSGKKYLTSSRDWIEWQANYFAASILMPRRTLLPAIENIQKNIGINRNVGFIYLENEKTSLEDYKKILSTLEIVYQVNRTNIEYRLKDLGIIIDNRNKNTKHISELLKEE